MFDETKSVFICYPSWKARGEVFIPESVNTLGRGAFSGCKYMKKINLHNVSIIKKSYFTNCDNLEKVYCFDLVQYIVDWVFKHCNNLKFISIFKQTKINKKYNAFSNSPTKISIRNKRTNYLIESENNFSLKSMFIMYSESIDSILIDPPYNSNASVEYKDTNFDFGYYKFMKSKIELSYKPLSKFSFLIINIDASEKNTIVDVCREVFEKKFVSLHKWKKKT